ncbi:hypothetical protein [Paenibacillus pinihumi]|uniref:hypothetical protein n=1 Tax=Paenibacillus pinihumi TaxID=669462 RepID=UPI0003FCE721|nr:hypothetical protein [Paenibacillus pinihumi]
MRLTFTCDCGNEVRFFGTGDMDDHGMEALDLEDDDRLRVIVGDAGLILQCKFCNNRYIIDKSLNT